MILKDWNELQCNIFRSEGVKNTVEVYKMASLLATLRDLDDKEEITVKAKKIIQSYRTKCMGNDVEIEMDEDRKWQEVIV